MVAEGSNEVPRHPLGGRYGTPSSRWCQGDRQRPPGVGWVTDVDSPLWRPYNHTAAEPELNLFKKTGAASVYSSVLGPWHSCLHTAGTQGLLGNDCPHFTDKETEAERGLSNFPKVTQLEWYTRIRTRDCPSPNPVPFDICFILCARCHMKKGNL